MTKVVFKRIVIVMPDYKEMYRILFRETTKAISALQAAQQQTEELYIEDQAVDNLIVLSPDNDDNEQPPQK